MGDRDITGMKAENWKMPSVSGLDKYSVSSKKDNIELFEQIRGLVEESIRVLYGDAKKDDKYVKIVNLIMMRIRAHLNEKFEDLETESGLTDEQQQALLDAIQEKLDAVATSGTGTAGQVEQTVESQIDETAQSIQKSESGESAAELSSSATDETGTSDISDILQQLSLKIDAYQQTIREELDALEDIVLESVNSYQTATTALTGGTDTKAIALLNKNITTLDGKMQNYVEQLELISDVDQTENSEEVEKLNKKQMAKQLVEIKDVIDQNFDVLKVDVVDINSQIQKKLNDNTELLEKINKNLSKNFSMAGLLIILGVIGVVLIMLFWNKIKEKVKKWFTNFPFVKTVMGIIDVISSITDKVLNFIDTLINFDFQKFLETNMPLIRQGIITGLTWIWDKIKKFFSDPSSMIASLGKAICDLAKQVADFGKDIWNWVTGKSKEIETAQSENEKKAEAYADTAAADEVERGNRLLENQMKAQDAAAQAQADNLDKQLTDTSKSFESSMQDINNSALNNVKDINKSVTDAVDGVTKQVETAGTDAASNLEEVGKDQLEKTSANLDKKLDTATSSMDKTVNGAITNAQEKADQDIKKVEEDMKAKGNPVDVSQASLDQLEQQAGTAGADLGKGIDSAPKGPESVQKTTIEEQGKTTLLVSDKKQLAEGQQNLQNAQKLSGQVYTSGATSDNINTTNNIKIEDRMPDFKSIISDTYKDIETGLDDIVKNLNTENDTLAKIKDNITGYLTKLNDFIASKQTSSAANKAGQTGQPNSPTAVIIADAGRSNAIPGSENR